MPSRSWQFRIDDISVLTGIILNGFEKDEGSYGHEFKRY